MLTASTRCGPFALIRLMAILALEEPWNGWDEPSNPETAALLDGALQAAWRGIPVLPLDGKKPVDKWLPHGVYDATRDEGLIRTWWVDDALYNVGGAIPKGVVVLDVDPRNGGDVALETLCRPYGGVPRTLRCNSGGRDRGYHLWLRYDGRPLSAKRLDGIDLKKHGGYVVLPPSIHPESRQEYEWADPASFATMTSRLPELPFFLYDALSDSTSSDRLLSLPEQTPKGPSSSTSLPPRTQPEIFLLSPGEQSRTHIVGRGFIGTTYGGVGTGSVEGRTHIVSRGLIGTTYRGGVGTGGVEGVLFPDDDSRERFRYIGYAREKGWSLSHFLTELRDEGSPVARYSALALNGKHGNDLAGIAAADWRRSEERDSARERTSHGGAAPRLRPRVHNKNEVPLSPSIGRWLTHALTRVRESRRWPELEAVLEGFARVAANSGDELLCSYRHLMSEAGFDGLGHLYDLVAELRGFGLVEPQTRTPEQVEEGEPTRWALLGEADTPMPSVPELHVAWTTVTAGPRAQALHRLLLLGVRTMSELETELCVSRNTLKTHLGELERRRLARRTGSGRWVEWTGLPLEGAIGVEADEQAWRKVRMGLSRQTRTFRKNGCKNLGTRPPSDEWIAADVVLENAVRESSELRTFLSYQLQVGDGNAWSEIARAEGR